MSDILEGVLFIGGLVISICLGMAILIFVDYYGSSYFIDKSQWYCSSYNLKGQDIQCNTYQRKL